jgi:2,3-bisphosphoglycerate-independent phosphoglycerate mutase
MTRVLFLFVDGLGLGADDPTLNPLMGAKMPTVRSLLDGRSLTADSPPLHTERASLVSVDACLGMGGRPQSATGQAALLSGRNVPKEIGEHFGPKPNQAIRDILDQDNLFRNVLERGGKAALLNAYPPAYFAAIQSGRRLHSAITYAASSAGISIRTAKHLQDGQALSADLTGEGWAARSDFPPAPVYAPEEAGGLLANLAREYQLAWFDYWLLDYAGHRGDIAQARALLETCDGVIAGVLNTAESASSLIVLTSDHGNVEDMGRRGHTLNPVPALLIGPKSLRLQFTAHLKDLTGFADPILQAIFA